MCSPGQTTQPLAWHHFAFTVPAEWEVIRYTVSSKKGRLELHTRQGHQGTVMWQTCKAPPDIRKTQLVFYEKHVESTPGAADDSLKLNAEQVAGFEVAHLAEGQPLQAARYLEGPKVLLQWIFPGYRPARLREEWAPVLESFQPNSGADRSWHLFGLGVRLSEAYQPEEVRPFPASVTLQFTNKRKRKLTLERFGLPAELLAGRDLAAFYRHQLNRRGCRVDAIEPQTLPGGEGVHYRIRHRGEYRMDKMTGSWWKGEAYAWHNPDEKRLYGLSQFGPRRAPPLDLAALLESM